MNKRLFCILLSSILICSAVIAEPKAKDVALEASRKSTVDESVSYLNSQVEKITVAEEKRAVYIFLAGLLEELGRYSDAQGNYAKAAAISAANAEGMPKKSNQQLVIDAVRCALCSGDYLTADSYLNSSVRNSKNEQIQTYVKLYTQWSALCAAETVDDLQEPLELLKAYLKIDSMKSVHPVILLTLWYVTGNTSYSKEITDKFPNSTESAIVKGDVQLLPTPFWFFVPKSGEAEVGTGSYAITEEKPAEKTEKSAKTGTELKTTSEPVIQKFSKWQLGLFKTESNAKLLSDELKTKGFEAYVTSEKRASGTVYYIVLVNETKEGNVADRLRSAGYDCYPVD